MVDLPEGFEARDPFLAKEIEAISRAVGRPLPADYAGFVSLHGGAFAADDDRIVTATWQRIDGQPLDPSEAAEFEQIYLFPGLWPAAQVLDEIETVRRASINGNVIPTRFLPIAHDTGGAVYWIDMEDESIWVWFTNVNELWGTGDNAHIGRVADSFTDLLENRLQPVPEDW